MKKMRISLFVITVVLFLSSFVFKSKTIESDDWKNVKIEKSKSEFDWPSGYEMIGEGILELSPVPTSIETIPNEKIIELKKYTHSLGGALVKIDFDYIKLDDGLFYLIFKEST